MKLRLIINDNIPTNHRTYEDLQNELYDISKHMDHHYSKLTEIQQEDLRDTFSLMPDSELSALLTDPNSISKLRKGITKDRRRQDAVLTLIEFEQERREIKCLLYDYQERKEALTLISRQSESDIIRARLKAFGASLRSKHN